MLTDVTAKVFNHHFPGPSHPFISDAFISLNSHKADKVVRLAGNIGNLSIGLIAGIRQGVVLSPFSAPFGGFHYSHENIYIHEIEVFADELKAYVQDHGYTRISVTFPPSIYGISFNAKMINVLTRKQFSHQVPELTNLVDLNSFESRFSQRNSREYYNQAIRNNLAFRKISGLDEKTAAYALIAENRRRFNRPIYLQMEDLQKTAELWPVDFFGVYDVAGTLLASAIFYQFPRQIAYAVYWGDNEAGRPLRAMDFLSFNLWHHYKDKGFSFIDLGISTESGGTPNEGLLRFKETHEATTELRHTLTWAPGSSE